MRGFTLVEVMIVLVILAVLGAMAYPTYAGYIRKTRRIEAQLVLLQAMQQEERHFTQHRRYKAFSALDGSSGPFRWWSGSTAAASAYEIDAYPCPNSTLAACIVLRARPGTERVDGRFRDPECATLTRDSAGRQTSSGTLDGCWP